MRRDGFTLVEILTALVLSGIGVAIAAGIFTTASQAVDTMERRAKRAELDAEALLWLRDALLATDVSLEPERSFIGTADRMSFTAWLPVAAGWSEPVPVVVSFDSSRLSVRTSRGTYALQDSLSHAVFEYLGEYGADSPWLVSWESGTGAPLALRLRYVGVTGRADTTLLYVGRAQ